jgi:acetyl esterase
MKYGWDLYAPDEKTRNLPYVSPLRASDEELKGEAYAHKLANAGVPVTD